ncbi:MAG TPA: hypothetical protein VF787_03515 [Thermoanaerobaculia bacterium]
MRRPAVALLLIFTTVFAFTQEKPFGVVANVTAIEVTAEVVDANGRIPSDLKASDFVIFEDGVERPVASLEYLCAQCGPVAPAETTAAASSAPSAPAATGWDILIYIDYELSSRTTTRDAVKTLIAESERMTRNGRVEVVVADPTPRRILAPSNDPKAVADALTTANKITAQSRLANVRRAFIETTDDTQNGREPSYAGMNDMRSSVAEENTLVQNFLGRLSAWLGGYPRASSRALFLVADGFDVNPTDFYSDSMAPNVSPERHTSNRIAAGKGALPADYRAQKQSTQARTQSGIMTGEEMRETARAYHPLARQAAAAGWTIVSLRGGLNAELSASSSMGSGNKVVSNFNTSGGGTGRATGSLQTRPVEALATFAEATGGTLTADTSKFGKTIDTLANRVRLTYQVERPTDGIVRQIEVVSKRDGLKVNAARYSSSSTPELVANSRTASLIDNAAIAGELPVTAKLQLEKAKGRDNPAGTLEARVGLAPIAPIKGQLKQATLRVTIGVATGKDQPRIIHQLHPNFDLSKLTNATFTSPMQLPKNVDKIAIVIEELSTGAWGGTVLPIAKNQDVITTAGWSELGADPMNWIPMDQALKEAQKVGKLILQCAGCDEKMFADSTLRNTLNAFVVTNKPDATPHVLLLDPWGHQRFDWKPVNAPDLVAKLKMAMSVGSALVQAGAQGDTPEAHFSLGFAYLRTQAFTDAQKEYDLAEAGARAKGDLVLAQRAQIQSAAALGGQPNKRNEAIASLEKIVKTPQSPSTEAEAWLILGHLRRGNGNEKGARDAYSNAAQRAPSGSELQKVATKLASGG